MMGSQKQHMAACRGPRPAGARTCRHCAYGLADPHGSPATITCLNHVEAPGQLRSVAADATCRNFRARRSLPVRAEPPAPPNDDVRYIALTQGKFAIVDAADYEWLSRYKWTASCKGDKCYAYRKDKGRNILMHRLIAQAPPGMVVDHIDGNSANNRRGNLRVCTQAENCRNAKPRVGTSRFKGVRAHNAPGKFAAEITFEGRAEYLGSFTDEIEAALVYDLRAIVLFAEFARPNFPHIVNATSQAKKLKEQVARAGA